jgi:hypothetical protein
MKEKVILFHFLELLLCLASIALAIFAAVNFAPQEKAPLILWAILCGWMANMLYIIIMKFVKMWLKV